jgi:hypothetical protein
MRSQASFNITTKEAFLLSPNDEFANVLWGAQAIADYIGKTYRQTTYMLENGRLPAQKLGSVWVGNKEKIRARLLGDEEVA